jgi:hypothetical protein
MQQITISRNRLVFTLVGIVLYLASLHIGVLIVYYSINDPDVFDFVDMVDFDVEGNLPTLYSAMAIFLASLLLAAIWRLRKKQGDRDHKYWLGLLIIFVFLGLDEGVAIHEHVGDFFESLKILPAEGFLYFAWVIPYGALLLLFTALYLRFLWRLPKATRWGLILAGVIFLAGAVGVEVISAEEADKHGTSTLRYSVLYTIEELLEMAGIIFFIGVLVHYLASSVGRFLLVFDSGQQIQAQAEEP